MTPAEPSFDARYPHIAAWVMIHGWIEIGRDDYRRSLVRALDIGGMVWEGEQEYATMDVVLQALEEGLAKWLESQGLQAAMP